MKRIVFAALFFLLTNSPETTAILPGQNIQGIEQISSDDLELLWQERLEEARRLGMP